MRTRLVALVSGSAAAVVVAAAQSGAGGLTSYTNDYVKWPRLNAKHYVLTVR